MKRVLYAFVLIFPHGIAVVSSGDTDCKPWCSQGEAGQNWQAATDPTCGYANCAACPQCNNFVRQTTAAPTATTAAPTATTAAPTATTAAATDCKPWCSQGEYGKNWKTGSSPTCGYAGCAACSQCDDFVAQTTAAPTTTAPSASTTTTTTTTTSKLTVAELFTLTDAAAARVDELEEKLFNSTLHMSQVEADLGTAGIGLGDGDQIAVPLEDGLRSDKLFLTQQVTKSGQDEVKINNMLSTIEHGTALVKNGTEELKGPLGAVVRSADRIAEKLRDQNNKIPLLNRLRKDTKRYDEFYGNVTLEIRNRAEKYRDTVDSVRSTMWKLGKTVLTYGIPSEMNTSEVLAASEKASEELAASEAGETTESGDDSDAPAEASSEESEA